MPQRSVAKKKKTTKNGTGKLVALKDVGRLFSFVIPGWVSAAGPQEAKRHAEQIGRGMLVGSRYNEWQDVYQLELTLAPRVRRRLYWTVTSVRECKEGILVQNAYGMESVQLVPEKPKESHPFLQSLSELRHVPPG